jgi:hypothetical protein
MPRSLPPAGDFPYVWKIDRWKNIEPVASIFNPFSRKETILRRDERI